MLTELVGEKSLERFRIEYEKLQRALKKCRELNTEKDLKELSTIKQLAQAGVSSWHRQESAPDT